MKLYKSHRQLEEVVSDEKYTYHQRVKQYTDKVRRMENTKSRFLPNEGLDMFDRFYNNKERPPSPTEYVNEYVRLVKQETLKNANVRRKHQPDLPLNTHIIDFGDPKLWTTWTEEVDHYMRLRAERTYVSLMAELSAITHLRELYPNSIILASKTLDTSFGVDIVIAFPEENKTLYLHITKRSRYAKDSVKGKFKRFGPAFTQYDVVNQIEDPKPKWYVKGSGNNPQGFSRGQKASTQYRETNPAHIILGYEGIEEGKETSDIEREQLLQDGILDINNNRLFTKEYIKEVIDSALKGTHADYQFDRRMRLSYGGPEEDLAFMEQNESFTNSELIHYSQWLKLNGITPNGVNDYIIYNQGQATFID